MKVSFGKKGMCIRFSTVSYAAMMEEGLTRLIFEKVDMKVQGNLAIDFGKIKASQEECMRMSLIPDEHREEIRNQLAQNLVNPVRVIMFTQEMECHFCAETKQLIMELAALNDKIKAEVHDFVADAQLAKDYGVDKVPALVILGEKDYGIRFYGLPFGYEFQTLLQTLTAVSQAKTDLAEETKAKLREIKTPVNIKVFVTLTCPHCPVAASLAQKFAMENDLIKAEVIDGNEFPQLALKYGVMGVPKTVINEKVDFVGAVPENMFLQHALLATQ